MRKIITMAVLSTAVSSGLLASSALAQDDNLQTDIFTRQGRLAVWTDVTNLLTAEDYNRLKEGVDVAIELKFRLVRSRRFFGEKEVAAADEILRLHRSRVTADFTVLRISGSRSAEYSNISRVQMDRLLSDSIVVDLTDLQEVERDRQYRINLKTTVITLTDINLAQPRNVDSTGGESAIQYLFRQFLSVTGYGRRETSAHSDPFIPSEMTAGR